MTKMPTSNFHAAVVTLEVFAGAYLPNCKREAAIVALQEGRTVKFVHNGRWYAAYPAKLEEAVGEDAQ